MRGAVAAGHPLTAEAGARVLERGGNAVDAAVGAAFVSWVAEGTLTGPGAGGFMLVQRDLARTREGLAERGAADMYHGGLARASVAHIEAGGGCITERDLADYRVIRRRPVQTDFRGMEFLSNPPPSAGGILIAYGLGLLDDRGAPGSAEAIDSLARVMREQLRARADGLDRAPRHRGPPTHRARR